LEIQSYSAAGSQQHHDSPQSEAAHLIEPEDLSTLSVNGLTRPWRQLSERRDLLLNTTHRASVAIGAASHYPART
jgi:hypothetical protein